MKCNKTVVGVDTAKRVFQLYWVDMETGDCGLAAVAGEFLEHFVNRAPCLVAMEACGGSQGRAGCWLSATRSGCCPRRWSVPS